MAEGRAAVFVGTEVAVVPKQREMVLLLLDCVRTLLDEVVKRRSMAQIDESKGLYVLSLLITSRRCYGEQQLLRCSESIMVCRLAARSSRHLKEGVF